MQMPQLNMDVRLWDFAMTIDSQSGISLILHWPFELQRPLRQTYSAGIIRRTVRLDSITENTAQTTTTLIPTIQQSKLSQGSQRISRRG